MTEGESTPSSEPALAFARIAALVAFYAGIALIATWPLVLHIGSALPRGREPVATVPLFNAWTIWWNCDRATHLYAGYWDAPIFHPVENAFAFSEPMPLTAIGWPLWAATGNLAIVYNTLLLAALTWNGFAGFQLARRLGVAPAVAIAGGILVETLPFVFNESGVFQLVPVFGIIYVLIALDAFAAAPALRRAACFAGAFALTYHLCTYYALFLALVLPLPAVVILGRSLLQLRTWARLAASGVIAFVLILPTFWMQWRITREYDMTRPHTLIQELSARVTDYQPGPWRPWFYPDLGSAQARFHIRLSPGVVKCALAVVGAIYGLCRGRLRRWTIALAALVGTAFLLSLGLNLKFGEWAPYDWLMSWVPGLAEARNVFRFALFVHLGVAFLAVLGIQAIVDLSIKRDSAAKWRRWAPWAVAALVALAAIGELWPPRQFLSTLSDSRKHSAWLSWLSQETAPEAVTACVPFPTGVTVEAYEATAEWMYFGTQHRRRMVNGYSGFFPPSFLQLKAAMAHFPSEASLQALSAAGVDYVVVARNPYAPLGAAISSSASAPRLTRVFADDEAQLDIYRLTRQGAN